MDRTTFQKREALKELGKNARRNIYDMLALAAEILDDHPYVDREGGEVAVIEAMESEEFAHFAGTPDLATMVGAYRRIREQSLARGERDLDVWEEYRYNISAIILVAYPDERRTYNRPAYKEIAETNQLALRAVAAEKTKVEKEKAKIEKALERVSTEKEQIAAKVEEFEVKATEAEKVAVEFKAKAQTAEERIEELEAENAMLRQRVQELEALLGEQSLLQH